MTRFPPSADVPPVHVAGFRAVWTTAWEAEAPGFGVYVLEDPDAPLEALDESTFEASDERMPYFASLWPSGSSLAAEVLRADLGAFARVLDLGCGLGAPGLAAATRGSRVTFVDWAPPALELVAHSARVLGVVPEACVAADWRADRALEGTFDLILGADLLYEERNGPAVLAFLAAGLRPGGQAWIADPGRDGLEPFLGGLGTHGLRLADQGVRMLAPRPHGVDVRRIVVVR